MAVVDPHAGSDIVVPDQAHFRLDPGEFEKIEQINPHDDPMSPSHKSDAEWASQPTKPNGHVLPVAWKSAHGQAHVSHDAVYIPWRELAAPDDALVPCKPVKSHQCDSDKDQVHEPEDQSLTESIESLSSNGSTTTTAFIIDGTLVPSICLVVIVPTECHTHPPPLCVHSVARGLGYFVYVF